MGTSEVSEEIFEDIARLKAVQNGAGMIRSSSDCLPLHAFACLCLDKQGCSRQRRQVSAVLWRAALALSSQHGNARKQVRRGACGRV